MRTDLQRLKRDAEAGRVAVASADHLGSTSHVVTVATVLTYKDFLMLWKDADPEIPILK